MLYAVLCYNSEEMVCSWTREEDDAVRLYLPGAPVEGAYSR